MTEMIKIARRHTYEETDGEENDEESIRKLERIFGFFVFFSVCRNLKSIPMLELMSFRCKKNIF